MMNDIQRSEAVQLLQRMYREATDQEEREQIVKLTKLIMERENEHE